MATTTARPKQRNGVRRWPASIALLLIGLAYLLLSDEYRIGPPWLVLLLILAFEIPINITGRRGAARITRPLAFTLSTLVTLAVISSAVFLVTGLVHGGKTPAPMLLRDGAEIWLVNVFVFALWYWEIDGGGPARRIPGHYKSTDFLFPQRSIDETSFPDWSPEFIDYLFLSFNTSAAFSPTDTLILTRRAKGLMMIQALISIVVLAVLVARAINTLGG